MKSACLRAGCRLAAVAMLLGILPGCATLVGDLAYWFAFPPRIAILDVPTGKTIVVGRPSERVVSVSESSKTFCTIGNAFGPGHSLIVRTYGFDGTRKSAHKYPLSLVEGLGEREYALSPKGNVLAYASWDSSDGSPRLFHPDTGASEAVIPGLLPTWEEARAARRDAGDLLRIEWLSDTQLALTIPEGAKLHPNTIALLDLPKGDLREIYRFPPGWRLYSRDVSFSADRRYVAFVETDAKGDYSRQTRVKILNLQTGQVFSAEEGDSVSFSPDSRRVAFAQERQVGRRSRSALKVFDLQTGEVLTAAENASGVGDPVWSPDSSRIAYRTGVSDRGIMSYSLRENASTEIKDFSEDPSRPSLGKFWFPDNQRLFCELNFHSEGAVGDTKLAVLDIHKGDLTIIARDSQWSPLPIDGGSKALCNLQVRRSKLRLRN